MSEKEELYETILINCWLATFSTYPTAELNGIRRMIESLADADLTKEINKIKEERNRRNERP